jgi:hypothetical protein
MHLFEVNNYGLCVANECLDCRMWSRDSRVLCKLDLEKAYGHDNWEFCYTCRRDVAFGAPPV